jgi:hypothetical protein
VKHLCRQSLAEAPEPPQALAVPLRTTCPRTYRSSSAVTDVVHIPG